MYYVQTADDMVKADLDSAITVIAVGATAYFLWKKFNKENLTPAQVENTLSSAGLTTRQSTIKGDLGTVFADTRSLSGVTTTFRFPEGDFDKLNFAQKFLIGVDTFVPGTFLTRKVLGG